MFSSFEEFAAHIGPRPSKNHTVDRKDNNKNYEAGNVRWATSVEQNRNRSDSKTWHVGGNVFESSSLAASAVGMGQSSIVRWCRTNTVRHHPKLGACWSEPRYPNENHGKLLPVN